MFYLVFKQSHPWNFHDRVLDLIHSWKDPTLSSSGLVDPSWFVWTQVQGSEGEVIYTLHPVERLEETRECFICYRGMGNHHS